MKMMFSSLQGNIVMRRRLHLEYKFMLKIDQNEVALKIIHSPLTYKRISEVSNAIRMLKLSRVPSLWMVAVVLDTAASLTSHLALFIRSLPVNTFSAHSWSDIWHDGSNLKTRFSSWKSWISQKVEEWWITKANHGRFACRCHVLETQHWCLIAAISLFMCDQGPIWVASLYTLILATWLWCCQEQAAAKVAGTPLKTAVTIVAPANTVIAVDQWGKRLEGTDKTNIFSIKISLKLLPPIATVIFGERGLSALKTMI